MDLITADRIRERDPKEAFAAYRSCADDLDLRRPEDAERALWLLLHLRSFDPALESLAVRAADAGAEPELTAQGNRVAALFAIERKRYAEAYERLRASLAHLSGRGDWTEQSAWINLARVALVEGREFEALVASRRAERASETNGNGPWLFHARLHRLSCLLEMEDWPRFDLLHETLREMLHDVPESQKASAEARILARAADSAAIRGNSKTALRWYERRILLLGRNIDQRDRITQAAFLALGGDAAEAVVQLRDARPEGRPSQLARWHRAYATVLASLSLNLRRGPDRARRFVQALGRAGPAHLGAGRRAEMASRIGCLLRELEQDRELTRLCFDVAGAALFERLRELEEFGRDFPDLVRLDDEDRHILRDFRARLLHRQREMLDAVGGLFEAAAGTEDFPVPKFRPGRRMLRVCAWCSRVDARDGEWTPIRHLLPPRDRVEVTHGICPECVRENRQPR